MDDYMIGAQLQISADTPAQARARAAKALRELQGQVAHAWLDAEPTRLFDAVAFQQIPGQLSID